MCGQPVDPLGFAANTLVLVVGIKGGPTTLNLPALPLGFKSIVGPGGSASLSVVATQAYAVVIPTAKLAGAVAGQPGVLVLMAQEGQGSSGGPSAYEQAKQHIRSKGKLFRAGMMRHPPGKPNDLQISTGQKFNTQPNTKYLWVIDEDGNLRIAQEVSTQNLPTWNGIKHPQLVNEGKVYGAGEVWFNADDTIRLNTESGRYMGRQSLADNHQALTFAQMLFKALGYSP